MARLTFEQWVERFKPLKNPFDPDAEDEGYAFELYGLQVDEVSKAHPNNTWTRVESDGVVTITNGRLFVNREKYYITEVPWRPDQFIEVPLFDPSDFEGSDEDEE